MKKTNIYIYIYKKNLVQILCSYFTLSIIFLNDNLKGYKAFIFGPILNGQGEKNERTGKVKG